MGRDGVYTPQVVVNGRVEGDGLEASALAGILRALQRPRREQARASAFPGGTVTVRAGVRACRRGRHAGLRAIGPFRTRSRSTVPRGENAGRTLPYTHVVREMVLLGKWRGEAAIFPAPGGDASLAEAAIVQGSRAGPILAAAKR